MSESFEELRPFLERRRRLAHLSSLLGYDVATTAPKKALEEEYELINYFGAELSELSKDKDFIAAAKKAKADPSLNERQKEVVDAICRDIEFFEKVDLDTYGEWVSTISKTAEAWREAKEKDDFISYLPYWEKEIEVMRKKAALWKKPEHVTLYDGCLDHFEKGLTTETLDRIFPPLKDFLVSALPEVLKKQEATPLPKIPFANADKQKHFSVDLLKLIGYDLDRGAIRESMHPFSDCVARNDARITTKIVESDFRSNLFSVIHEGGHAIEFQNFGAAQYDDFSEGLASCAICETHSRFYENIIGRSKNFAKPLQKLCQKHFGSPFYFLTRDSFFRLINDVKPDLIRTEADEFTYCLHIIIRYEIERDLINGDLLAKDAPLAWSKKYRDYLGVNVPNDRDGILQDVHWSEGLFGYFPTYALGNMYGAMILRRIKEELPFDKLLSTGDLLPIREWFAKNDFVYDYLPADEWLRRITGKEFDPNDYIEYLKEKFLDE